MDRASEGRTTIAVDALAVSRKSSGGFTVLLGLMRELMELCDYDFVIYTLCGDIEDKLGGYSGRIKYIYAPGWARAFVLRCLWQQFILPQLAKRAGCRLLYSASGYPELFTRLPIVSHQQNLWAFECPKKWWPKQNRKKVFLHRQISKLAVRISDINIYISDYIRECADRMVPSSRVKNFTIHNGLTLHRSLGTEDISDIKEILNSKYCLCVNTVAYHKNYIRLIEAFKLICEKCQDLNLVMVGRYDTDHGRLVFNLCRELGLEKRVIFLGSQDYNKIIHLYKHAFFSVNVSFLEGFGLTVLESMSQGCPVVCSNITAFPEIGGDSVLYCDPLDPLDIAEKMMRMYNDKDLRERFHKTGIERSNMFTWRNSAERLLEIFNRLIK